MIYCLVHLSSPEPKAHTVSELIGLPCSVVRLRCRPSKNSNIFFSETASPIKAKLRAEHPKEGGTKA